MSGLLHGARVYLSGPMDFVASREEEMKNGWRNRVGQFLRRFGVTVFDPWDKPKVQGLHEYGREGVDTDQIRRRWTFADSDEGAETRARIAGGFWETLHIDLRMVDTSDFVISYCPTNIYSVGTPHEIALCRQQRKPVLFVSPKVRFPALDRLNEHLEERRDTRGKELLAELVRQVPIKPNPQGIPSLWYMPLVGGEGFFDGFGFEPHMQEMDWEHSELDDRERDEPPQRPLLAFLTKLDSELPRKWNNRARCRVRNDDWLLWALEPTDHGAQVKKPHLVEEQEEAAD